jgi:hypothetical protein
MGDRQVSPLTAYLLNLALLRNAAITAEASPARNRLGDRLILAACSNASSIRCRSTQYHATPPQMEGYFMRGTPKSYFTAAAPSRQT